MQVLTRNSKFKVKYQRIIPLCLFLSLFAQCLYFAWTTGQTTDETYFNGSGYLMVRHNDYSVQSEHPPLMQQLGALPLLFLQPNYPVDEMIYVGDPKDKVIDNSKMGSKFLYDMGNNPQIILFLERIPIILITLVLGCYVLKWSYELFGSVAAFISLFFFSFSPNIIAHGSLYTTDLGVAAFFFITFYYVYKYVENPVVKNLFLVGLFMGLTLLSKMSGIIAIPCILFLFLLSDNLRNNVKYEFGSVMNIKWLVAMAAFLFIMTLGEKIIFLAVCPMWIWTVRYYQLNCIPDNAKQFKWLFNFIFTSGWLLCGIFLVLAAKKMPLPFIIISSIWVVVLLIVSMAAGNHHVKSRLSKALTAFAFTLFVSLFVIILGYTNFYESISNFNPFAEFVGSFKKAMRHSLGSHKSWVGGFIPFDWRYFIGLVLVKTPLMTLLLTLVGVIAFMRMKLSKMTKCVVLLPPIIFLVSASFLNGIYIGLRHVLILYPFMFLLIGASVKMMSLHGVAWRKVVFSALVIGMSFMMVRNISLFPHYLSYFNEIVGNAEKGAEWVGDSNVLWGQDNKRLAELVKEKDISNIKVAIVTRNDALFDFYEMNWDQMDQDDFLQPESGYYAIDLRHYNNLQKNDESWFKGKRPDFRAGKTIYVFKVG